MKIVTTSSFIGYNPQHPLSETCSVLQYNDGTISCIPKSFFITPDNKPCSFGTFYIGPCSSMGIGSTVKYDHPSQILKVGKYVSLGMNIRFILGSMHNMNTASIFGFPFIGLPVAAPNILLGDTELKNDIWIGDEAMILGGVTVNDGCVIGARSLIPPRKVLEPYGIYAGNPSRLIRFRFDKKIIELLLEIQWWNQPVSWIRDHFDFFQTDLNKDIGCSIEKLNDIKRLLRNG